ncbi:unnamed protein product [Alopecurus aequalis]
MEKRPAVVLPLLVMLLLLSPCHGGEQNEKYHTVATAAHGARAGAGAFAGIGEVKVLGLPDLPVVGTVTITGPVVVGPAVP